MQRTLFGKFNSGVLYHVKQTLTELRASFWMTGRRNFVQKVVRRCIPCKKVNTTPFNYPSHSDMPVLRFNDRYPFASTGCDYLGPLHVKPVFEKETDELFKAYIIYIHVHLREL